jgi:hypothetical protein
MKSSLTHKIHIIERRKIMKKSLLLIVVLVLITLMTACTSEEVATTTDEASLTVGGKAYTLNELEALGTMSTDYTNKDGETTTYSGVQLITLLEDAGLSGDTLIFTAADGFEADLDMADALACTDCIVAFDNGSLRMVMPEMSGKLQVRDVVEIAAE